MGGRGTWKHVNGAPPPRAAGLAGPGSTRGGGGRGWGGGGGEGGQGPGGGVGVWGGRGPCKHVNAPPPPENA